MITALAALLLAGVPWTRDYTRAFADAEENRRPLLLFFTGECGGGNRPVNPIGAEGPIEHQEGLSACDRMQQDIWEDAAIAAAAARYLPVVVDGGDRTLQVRYQAVRMPTTIVTDPWGNEVFRTSGYIAKDKMARILAAVPQDFAALGEVGKALKARPDDMGALTGAARFYEGAGLPQVSERLYVNALNSPGAADVAARREAVIARGLNLMARLSQPLEAARLFEKELQGAPDAPGSDALMLGLVNAQLSAGKRKEAEAALQQMERKFPASAYTARAKQNLAAVGK